MQWIFSECLRESQATRDNAHGDRPGPNVQTQFSAQVIFNCICDIYDFKPARSIQKIVVLDAADREREQSISLTLAE